MTIVNDISLIVVRAGIFLKSTQLKRVKLNEIAYKQKNITHSIERHRNIK